MAKVDITAGKYVDYLKKVTAKIASEKDYITELDAATGDGDHWANMNTGFTKLMEIEDQLRAASLAELFKKAAMTIAKSPLVKTAFFGQDPNWGRIVSAVGYSETNINAEKLAVWLGAEQVVKGGMKADTDEEVLQKVMQQHDIVVTVDLGVGSAEATVWTCDFSYEYVKINGEYHT